LNFRIINASQASVRKTFQAFAYLEKRNIPDTQNVIFLSFCSWDSERKKVIIHFSNTARR